MVFGDIHKRWNIVPATLSHHSNEKWLVVYGIKWPTKRWLKLQLHLLPTSRPGLSVRLSVKVKQELSCLTLHIGVMIKTKAREWERRMTKEIICDKIQLLLFLLSCLITSSSPLSLSLIATSCNEYCIVSGMAWLGCYTFIITIHFHMTSPVATEHSNGTDGVGSHHLNEPNTKTGPNESK